MTMRSEKKVVWAQRALRCACLLWPAFVLGCGEEPVATEVLVLIDADAQLAASLSRLQVDIYDGRALSAPKQQLGIPLGAATRLPLSFSIAARDQDDSSEFRVVVTGFDAAERPRTEQQVITSFHPNSAGRLDIYLYTGCTDLCRGSEGQLGDKTCSKLGSCTDVPVVAMLPPAAPDALGGYAAGSVTLDGNRDAGVSPDAGISPDAGKGSLDGQVPAPGEAGASGPDSQVVAPQDADTDAKLSPVDAGQDPDAAREAGVDASRPDASNPDASNPDASNPDASKPDASNPDASNPDASNPDASKPSNPDASKPSNPDASNPDAR
jgi:hypothetical protein